MLARQPQVPGDRLPHCVFILHSNECHDRAHLCGCYRRCVGASWCSYAYLPAGTFALQVVTCVPGPLQIVPRMFDTSRRSSWRSPSQSVRWWSSARLPSHGSWRFLSPTSSRACFWCPQPPVGGGRTFACCSVAVGIALSRSTCVGGRTRGALVQDVDANRWRLLPDVQPCSVPWFNTMKVVNYGVSMWGSVMLLGAFLLGKDSLPASTLTYVCPTLVWGVYLR